MIDPEVRVQIRRYFYAEHWKVGTIAEALGLHPETVRRAIEVERFHHAEQLRASIPDPYLPLVRQTLETHPRLRATRLEQMLRDRGFTGSIRQLRRAVHHRGVRSTGASMEIPAKIIQILQLLIVPSIFSRESNSQRCWQEQICRG